MPTPNEDPVNSVLHMDRDGPLGNSEDVFGRRALHTKIGNKLTEPIPTYEAHPPVTPLITNIECPMADTEYSHAFHSNVRKFTFRARGRSRVQIAFVAGESSTNFLTLEKGIVASEDQISNPALTIYFQASQADEIIEVLEWF